MRKILVLVLSMFMITPCMGRPPRGRSASGTTPKKPNLEETSAR